MTVLAVAVPAAHPAAAQTRADSTPFGFGPRVGVSLNPHQFTVGGQAHFDHILPGARLVMPVVEVGLGDNQTILGLGGQLTAPVFQPFDGWQTQIGGELTLQRVFPDRGPADSMLGLMGVVNLERLLDNGDRFGLELKFEIIDTPGVKVLTTWTFGS